MTARRPRQPARGRKAATARRRSGSRRAPAAAKGSGGRRATAKGSGGRRATAKGSGGRRATAAKGPKTRKATPARTGRQPKRRTPGRLRRIVTGDRVYVFVFLGVAAVLATMAIGPLQNYTAAADRVDGLSETRDVLREEVDRLEERRERLHDPEQIELLARENLGMVNPGDVPFVVVTPEPELDRVHPDEADDSVTEPGPWYRQVGRWLGDLIS